MPRDRNFGYSCVKESWISGSVEVEVKERTLPLGVISNAGGMEDLEGNLRDMLGGMFQGKKKKRVDESAGCAEASDPGRSAKTYRYG